MRGRILVTGGAGFIGSHLARRLILKGYSVTIVDNLSTGSKENVPPEAEFLKVDLRRPDSTHELPRGPYKAVCHLAGQSSGEKSFEDPLDDFDANARSTLSLALWSIEQGIPTFLHASSMAVYGLVGDQPVSEVTHPRPISYYGASKHSAEQILRVVTAQRLRTCSLRMFSVYGPGQNLEDQKQGMVSIYLAYLLKQEPLIVKGSLDRIRDFVYVEDVVTAWEMALEGPAKGVLNVAGGCRTSVRALIAELLMAMGLHEDYPIRQIEATPGDQEVIFADIRAIRKGLGWEPRVPLRDGICRMVNWARTHQKFAL